MSVKYSEQILLPLEGDNAFSEGFEQEESPVEV